jgi:hypothetical protein
LWGGWYSCGLSRADGVAEHGRIQLINHPNRPQPKANRLPTDSQPKTNRNPTDNQPTAREKLRKKLEEDRKERRRKLGLPEELTEEEKVRGLSVEMVPVRM